MPPRTGNRNRWLNERPGSRSRRWEASVARRLPCRWNPLLLPGGVRPRFSFVTSDPLGRQLRSKSERLVIVGTCVNEPSRWLNPIGNRAFIALVDPISPPSTAASCARLMVEAPGYCPPGPKCLFHLTVYRHSRLPGTLQIGILRVNLKIMPLLWQCFATRDLRGTESDEKTGFCDDWCGCAGACRVQQRATRTRSRTPNSTSPSADQLNELANQAAMDAANAQARRPMRRMRECGQCRGRQCRQSRAKPTSKTSAACNRAANAARRERRSDPRRNADPRSRAAARAARAADGRTRGRDGVRGGRLVFPGGRIDEADRRARRGSGIDAAAVAAIRETIEETAVPVGLVADSRRCHLRSTLQDALVADRPFGELFASVTVSSTPPRSPRSPAGSRSSTPSGGSTPCSSSRAAPPATGSRTSSKASAPAPPGSRPREVLERDRRGRSAADLPDAPQPRTPRAALQLRRDPRRCARSSDRAGDALGRGARRRTLHHDSRPSWLSR